MNTAGLVIFFIVAASTAICLLAINYFAWKMIIEEISEVWDWKIKIFRRIQIVLRRPGMLGRFFQFFEIVTIYTWLGKLHPHWLSELARWTFLIYYTSGAHLKLIFNPQKSEVEKLIEQAGSYKNGAAPDSVPSDIEIHFFSNPNVPQSWKDRYMNDTPEGKQKFMAGYYTRLKAGQHGGYKK